MWKLVKEHEVVRFTHPSGEWIDVRKHVTKPELENMIRYRPSISDDLKSTQTFIEKAACFLIRDWSANVAFDSTTLNRLSVTDYNWIVQQVAIHLRQIISNNGYDPHGYSEFY